MPLNKTEICRELSASTGLGANAVKHVLDDLAELAGEQLEVGEQFIVPGICRIKYVHTPAAAKGSRWRKGEIKVNPFTGEEVVKESDSPPTKARIRMTIGAIGVVRKMKPGSKPQAQAEFIKSKTGKAVVRKSNK
jgi:Bacterial DNA-binding protein